MKSFSKGAFALLSRPRVLAAGAMLIALSVVFARFLSFQSQFLRVGFGFLPLAVFSLLFGPIPGAFAAAVADVVGYLAYPGGPYFPGFTASAALAGFLYGAFLYKRPVTLIRTGLCCLLVIALCDVGLNTLWLSILYTKQFELIIVSRLIKSAAMLPIETSLIMLFDRTVGKQVKSRLLY